MTKYRFKTHIKSYIQTGAVTFFILMAIFFIKGIWPFGSNRIDYFDNMQQVAPLYTHLWDWMHGQASLWFDWYTGLGTNISMSLSAFSMLSPFNVLLYIIPRNLILESFSLFIAVKMVFMAVTMNIYLNKKINCKSNNIKMVFALCYAFCGYTLLYGSCFMPWMDIVALFPVLMIAYDTMIQKGKKLFYILMIALLFIINYYISAMAVIYIFLVSGLYFLFICDKSKWKAHIWNLGIGTVTGIGLSACILVPVIFQLGSSQRGSAEGSLLNQYVNCISGSILSDRSLAAFQRYMMVYGMAFVIALIVVGLKQYWNEKNVRLYYGILILITIIPMFVEGTNLIWHFGSYNGYTLRNGFLIAFTLLSSGAYFADRLSLEFVWTKNIVKQIVIAVIAAVFFVVFYNIMPYKNEIIAIIFYMGIFVVLLTVYIKKLSKQPKHFNFGQIAAVMALELFVAIYTLIGLPEFYRCDPYQVGDYVQTANTVKETLDIESSVTDRIINPDISLNANYPLILERSALSSFTAALQKDTQSYAKRLGYSKYFLWLLDSGGTVFTNALFHVTQAVNINELDEKMYTPLRKDDKYTLYEANYQLPFAINVDSKAIYDKYDSDWIDIHNKLYFAVSNDDSKLVDKLRYTYKESSTVREYNALVEGNKALYISISDINNVDGDANTSWLISSMHIYVNDKPVLIPTLGDVKNTAYFTDYNNNLIYLGCFSDTNVSIRIEYDDAWFLKVSEVSLAGLDMDKMKSMTDMHKKDYCETSSTKDSLTIHMTGHLQTDNMALIPIVYSDNWNITVNGKKVEGKAICGLFTGVNIENGQNTITMTFEPKGKRLGMLITMITAALLLFGMVINSFIEGKGLAVLQYIALLIYWGLYSAVILAMFIIPCVTAIPALIYNLLKILNIF